MFVSILRLPLFKQSATFIFVQFIYQHQPDNAVEYEKKYKHEERNGNIGEAAKLFFEPAQNCFYTACIHSILIFQVVSNSTD